MSRECSVTGARPHKGHHIHRRGLAKKKGGIGTHVTAMTPREFVPNLQEKRIWVPELKKFVRVKLTARALKTVTKTVPTGPCTKRGSCSGFFSPRRWTARSLAPSDLRRKRLPRRWTAPSTYKRSASRTCQGRFVPGNGAAAAPSVRESPSPCRHGPGRSK